MRLGNYPQQWKQHHPCIWIHAASLGEINAIKKIINNLIKEFPTYKILISTITTTGYKKAQEEYEKKSYVIYAPLDISFIVKRTIDFFNPNILLITETELWPNLIMETNKKNIKICVINGRITQKTIKYFSKHKKIFSPILNSIDKYCVQNELEKNNFQNIGIDNKKIIICGQTKFDIKINIQDLEKENIKNLLQLKKEDFLWICGSTRPGEENIIIEAFLKIKKIKPCKLVIAPRHIDRTENIIKIIDEYKISYKKISSMSQTSDEPVEIFILDILGKLQTYYSIANVAFVGGTLKDFGGHNLIEPAFFACPVIFGEFTKNVSDMADLLLKTGGGTCVKDSIEIEQIILNYINNPEKAKIAGQKAFNAIKSKAGASERTVAEIKLL